MSLLMKEINKLHINQQTVCDGKIIFKLYDTYGFPYGLAEEILTNNNLILNKQNFNIAMLHQQQLSRGKD